MERVLFLAIESKNMDHRKEALWVVCNAITGADDNTRQKVFNKSNGEILRALV